MLLLVAIFAASIIPARAANTLYVFGSSTTNCKPLSKFVDGDSSWTTTSACLPGPNAATLNPINSGVFNGYLLLQMAPTGLTGWALFEIPVGSDPSVSSNWTNPLINLAITTKPQSMVCVTSGCIIVSGGSGSAGNYYTTDGHTWAGDGGSTYWLWSSVGSYPLITVNNSTAVYVKSSPGSGYAGAAGLPAVPTGGLTSSSTSAAYYASGTLYTSTNAGTASPTFTTTHGTCGASNPVGAMSTSVAANTVMQLFGTSQYCSQSGTGSWTTSTYTAALPSSPNFACSAGSADFILVSGYGVYGYNGTTALSPATGLTNATVCSVSGSMSGALAPFTPPVNTTMTIVVSYN